MSSTFVPEGPIVHEYEKISPETSDNVVVSLGVACAFTGKTKKTLQQYRHDQKGPDSFLWNARIVYRLGDLRAYTSARYEASLKQRRVS